MNILITGGNGFIGTHLIKKISAHYRSFYNGGAVNLYTFDRDRVSYPGYIRGDICDYFSLENAFEKTNPDVVVHLAAMVSRKECEETPLMALHTNVEGTFNIVKLCRKKHTRLIYAGSSEEYGTAFEIKRINEATPFGQPTSIYSMTKRMAEELIEYAAVKEWFQACTLRFFMLYGPGEKATDYRSAVIRFIDWAKRGEPIQVHAGTERSWCYIEDATEAIFKAIFRYHQQPAYQAINIGKDDPISTMKLARLIKKMTGSASKIITVPPDPTIIPVKRASFVLARAILEWEATTPIEEGLKKVIEGE